MEAITKKLKKVMESIWNIAPSNMVETKNGEADWFNHSVIYDKEHCVGLQYKYTIDNFQIKRLEELMGDKEVIVIIQASSGIMSCISPYMEILVYYNT